LPTYARLFGVEGAVVPRSSRLWAEKSLTAGHFDNRPSLGLVGPLWRKRLRPPSPYGVGGVGGGCVTVSVRVSVTVLVLVLVLTLVVLGVVVVVVDGVVDVLLGSVVVVVVVVSVGVWLCVSVTVGWVVKEWEGVVNGVNEVLVTVSEVESPVITLTSTYTIRARTSAATAPSATSAAGFRYQGCSGGGSGAAGWPYVS
jgi:hypothetical protein